MATVLLEEQIEIPTIHNLAEFRRWALSDDFPQRGRIDYITGRIEVNLVPTEIFTHGTLKTELVCKIHRQVEQLDLGHTTIGTRVSSIRGDYSASPDVVVITYQSFDEERVRLIPKASGEKDR